MATKFVSIADAIAQIPEGATIMFGGFLGCGSAHKVIDALAKSGKGGFTAICNDAAILGGPLGEAHYGIAKLIHNGQITHLIASHVGLNPEVAAQMHDGTLKLDLIPQGSLAEMIRAKGAGLGGVLTPTGVSTLVEESDYCHSKQEIDGKEYLLMRPLRADVAIICGRKVDKAGNVWYRGTTANFNVPMATAADIVIAEADEVVEVGAFEPENVHTYGVFVDYVVDGGQL